MLNQEGTVASFAPGDPLSSPSGSFLVDASEGGFRQEVHLVGVRWGRLVDVYGLSGGEPVAMQVDFPIGGSLVSDGSDYLLETNPITGRERLTILRDVNSQRDAFFLLLKQADLSLTQVFERPVTSSGSFSLVPRNSTVVLQFDDLLASSTISPETVLVRTGVPPTVPFEARVFLDRNHGDVVDHNGDGVAEFYPSRVIIDTTVSEVESFEADPPLPVNNLGLPASIDVDDANFVVRIPTRADSSVGQDVILLNPTGHPLTLIDNGPTEPSSPTADVVRAARSGGNAAITGDPANGFLPDATPPRVVGFQPVSIDIVPDPAGGDVTEFLLPSVTFGSAVCAQTPVAGDVLRQDDVFAEVTEAGAPPQGGTITDVHVRLIEWPAAWDEPGQDGPLEWLSSAVGPAIFLSAYDPVADSGKQSCFVSILPTPTGFAVDPVEGLSTNSTFTVQFSEAMDPASLSAFDSLTLTRAPVPPPGAPPLSSLAYVVGTVEPSFSLRQFMFTPERALDHTFNAPNTYYYLTLASGAFAPTDLAGNKLPQAFPGIRTHIDPAAATERNASRVTRFTSPDEEVPFEDEQTMDPQPLPEWSGQHVYDLPLERILPRPVTRFQVLADDSEALPAAMTVIPGGTRDPLNGLGCKMQTIWRYVDVGLAVSDITTYNVDVEGLSWAPVGGQVVVDRFDEFEMRLAHSKFLPDEVFNPLPFFPSSGLVKNFGVNLVNSTEDPQKTVHPKFRGYVINPGDKFTAASGTQMVPFPMNHGISPAQYSYYTWRDTGIRARGGPSTSGADPCSYYLATGISIGTCPPSGMDPVRQFYSVDNVQSVGLPLLMEFRCYPDDTAQGINSFDVSLAITASFAPFFRVFSAGGTNQAGQEVLVDPDLQTQGNGGFNPNSIPNAGAPTGPLDNFFYKGAIDLVTRISRSHSLWYPVVDSDGSDFFNAHFQPPVVEPAAADQPAGTQIRLAFRGATQITQQTGPPDDADVTSVLNNALTLDDYGDWYDPETIPPIHDQALANGGITFLQGDTWHTDISDLDGALFYQVRVTFVSNAATGQRPTLSALALSWTD